MAKTRYCAEELAVFEVHAKSLIEKTAFSAFQDIDICRLTEINFVRPQRRLADHASVSHSARCQSRAGLQQSACVHANSSHRPAEDTESSILISIEKTGTARLASEHPKMVLLSFQPTLSHALTLCQAAGELPPSQAAHQQLLRLQRPPYRHDCWRPECQDRLPHQRDT